MKRAGSLRVPGLLVVIAVCSCGCAQVQTGAPLRQAQIPVPAGQRQTAAAAPPAPAEIRVPQPIVAQVPDPGHPVMVVTNPPGATISVSGTVLGISPGKIYVLRKPNRYGFLPRMTVIATPPAFAKGQYMQSRTFDGYTDTPDLIIFNMTEKQPVPMVEGAR